MKNQGVQILLIDDDEIFQFIIKEFMQIHYPEIQITIMQVASDALQYLSTRQGIEFPHLIICDLEMPGMDGFDFLEEYDRKIYPDHQETPVIIMSISGNKKALAKLKTFVSLKEIIVKTDVQHDFRYILQKYIHPKVYD